MVFGNWDSLTRLFSLDTSFVLDADFFLGASGVLGASLRLDFSVVQWKFFDAVNSQHSRFLISIALSSVSKQEFRRQKNKLNQTRGSI